MSQPQSSPHSVSDVPVPKPAPTCEPVFVVGMNGSGTSMMLDSLGRHPELYAVPDETHMMPYIIARAHRFGDLEDDRNFTRFGEFAIRHLPVLQRFTGRRKPELPGDWLSLPRTIAGVFHGLFGSLAARQGKVRWCEKTPDHVQHIAMLADVFPGSRFIHMIRDGREVAFSLGRRQRRQPELVIYRWKKLVEAGRAAGSKLPGRYLETHYEELTRDARPQMQRICDFLQLEFDEAVLQSRLPQNPRRRHLAQGEIGVIGSNPVKWPEHFDADTVQRLEAIGGRTLNELGYEVRTEAGDSEPGKLHLRLWRLLDFIRLTIDRKKHSQRYKSWRKLASKTLFSFREYRSKRY